MKYTGTLNKPITKRLKGLINTPIDGNPVDHEQIRKERVAKLPDLFRAHQTPDGNWMDLALSLATAHVPGFKVVERAGRKIEWDDFQKAKFRIDVDAIISKSSKKMSVTQAIGHAQSREAWREKTNNMKIPALSKHYYSANPDVVEFLKNRKPKKQLSKVNSS